MRKMKSILRRKEKKNWRRRKNNYLHSRIRGGERRECRRKEMVIY
jgi:hypothetical protein